MWVDVRVAKYSKRGSVSVTVVFKSYRGRRKEHGVEEVRRGI